MERAGTQPETEPAVTWSHVGMISPAVASFMSASVGTRMNCDLMSTESAPPCGTRATGREDAFGDSKITVKTEPTWRTMGGSIFWSATCRMRAALRAAEALSVTGTNWSVDQRSTVSETERSELQPELAENAAARKAINEEERTRAAVRRGMGVLRAASGRRAERHYRRRMLANGKGGAEASPPEGVTQYVQ